MSLIAALSVIGVPYYVSFLSIPLLEQSFFLTRWHRNHWIGLLSMSAIVIGSGTFTLALILQQRMLPSFYLLVIIGLLINIAGIVFEKALALYKIDLRAEELRASQILHEKIGVKFGRLLSQGVALAIAGLLSWQASYFLISIIFMIYGLITACLSVQPHDSIKKNNIFNICDLYDLAQKECYFLLFCLFISLSDQVTAYFLLMYLKDIGLSYLQIAKMAKIAAVFHVTIGAYLAYYLMRYHQAQRLLLIVSTLHLISLMALGYPHSSYALWALFFLKNMTLGSKILLLSILKNNYIAQISEISNTRRQLFFLSRLIRVVGIFCCMLCGIFYQHLTSCQFFILVSSLSLPGLLMLLTKKFQKVEARLPGSVTDIASFV